MALVARQGRQAPTSVAASTVCSVGAVPVFFPDAAIAQTLQPVKIGPDKEACGHEGQDEQEHIAQPATVLQRSLEALARLRHDRERVGCTAKVAVGGGGRSGAVSSGGRIGDGGDGDRVGGLGGFLECIFGMLVVGDEGGGFGGESVVVGG